MTNDKQEQTKTPRENKRRRTSIAERAIAEYSPGEIVVVKWATEEEFDATVISKYDWFGTKCYRLKAGKRRIRVVAERILGLVK